MHKLLQDRPGEKIMLLGNEAIARGAVEAGVAFATTYPGCHGFPGTSGRSAGKARR